MLGGCAGTRLGVVGVPGGLQLGPHSGGEPVAGTDRCHQRAADQLAEGRVGVGVAHEGGQVCLVRDLAAERDREPEGLAGRGAQPGRQQRGGRGSLGERRQGDVVLVRGRPERRVDQ